MKKTEMINLISSSIGTTKIMRMYFKYDEDYWYYYPNAVNERFVLGQEENDFELDGYHIRKISDLTKAEIKEDLCEQINVWNGLFQEIHDPQVNITSWQSIFQSPVLLNKLIIIQDEYNGELYLGVIRKACKRYVQIDSYDADGVLSEEPVRIPYSSITHVAWDTRYTHNWQQYMESKQMLK